MYNLVYQISDIFSVVSGYHGLYHIPKVPFAVSIIKCSFSCTKYQVCRRVAINPLAVPPWPRQWMSCFWGAVSVAYGVHVLVVDGVASVRRLWSQYPHWAWKFSPLIGGLYTFPWTRTHLKLNKCIYIYTKDELPALLSIRYTLCCTKDKIYTLLCQKSYEPSCIPMLYK